MYCSLPTLKTGAVLLGSLAAVHFFMFPCITFSVLMYLFEDYYTSLSFINYRFVSHTHKHIYYILLSLHILSSRSNRDFSCYSCYWPCQLCRWHSSRLLYRSFHVSGPHQLFPFSYIPHLGPRPVLVPCLLLPDDLLEHCQLRVGTYIALQAFHVEQSSLR